MSVPGTKRPSSVESEPVLVDRGVTGARTPLAAWVGMSEAGEAADKRAPHSPQNRVASGFSAKQRAHWAIGQLTFSIACGGKLLPLVDQFMEFAPGPPGAGQVGEDLP